MSCGDVEVEHFNDNRCDGDKSDDSAVKEDSDSSDSDHSSFTPDERLAYKKTRARRREQRRLKAAEKRRISEALADADRSSFDQESSVAESLETAHTMTSNKYVEDGDDETLRMWSELDRACAKHWPLSRLNQNIHMFAVLSAVLHADQIQIRPLVL